MTLVWRSDDVAWDPEKQAIIYRYAVDPQATAFSIQDGDEVRIGGVQGFPFGGADPVWLAPPDEECPQERIFVDQARLPE